MTAQAPAQALALAQALTLHLLYSVVNKSFFFSLLAQPQIFYTLFPHDHVVPLDQIPAPHLTMIWISYWIKYIIIFNILYIIEFNTLKLISIIKLKYHPTLNVYIIMFACIYECMFICTHLSIYLHVYTSKSLSYLNLKVAEYEMKGFYEWNASPTWIIYVPNNLSNKGK